MRFLLRLTLFNPFWMLGMFGMFGKIRLSRFWSLVFRNLWMRARSGRMNDWLIAKTKRSISCLNTTTLVSPIIFTLFFIINFTSASVFLLIFADALRNTFFFHFLCVFLADSWSFCRFRFKQCWHLTLVRYIFFNSKWTYSFFWLFYCVIVNYA